MIIYKFTVPARYQREGTPSWFRMKELSVREEAQAQAQARAQEKSTAAAYEMAKAALIDTSLGKLSWEDNSRDKLFETMSPVVRQLMVVAFHRIHQPNDEASLAFLDTMEVVAE